MSLSLALAVYCSGYGFHVINLGIGFNNAFISFVDFYCNLFNCEGVSIIITRFQFSCFEISSNTGKVFF